MGRSNVFREMRRITALILAMLMIAGESGSALAVESGDFDIAAGTAVSVVEESQGSDSGETVVENPESDSGEEQISAYGETAVTENSESAGNDLPVEVRIDGDGSAEPNEATIQTAAVEPFETSVSETSCEDDHDFGDAIVPLWSMTEESMQKDVKEESLVSVGVSQSSKEKVQQAIREYCDPKIGTAGEGLAYYKNGQWKAGQCHAFVNFAWKFIFGYDVFDRKFVSQDQYDWNNFRSYILNNARPGDILRVANGPAPHSRLIYGVDNNSVTFYELGGFATSYVVGKRTKTYEQLKTQYMSSWQNKTYFLYQIYDNIYQSVAPDTEKPIITRVLNITGRRSRLSGGGRATCPDFRSHPV